MVEIKPSYRNEENGYRYYDEDDLKKTQLDISKARFQMLEEGVCVQMMHIGPFDNEPETVNEIKDYIEDNNLRNAISEVSDDGSIRRHHEIYLSDPRKADKQKMKIVLRIPVENK